jgi:tetratricopeptide (TPR) repeat protein
MSKAMVLVAAAGTAVCGWPEAGRAAPAQEPPPISVAAFVIPKHQKLARPLRATTLLVLESALRRNPRLQVIDTDLRLAGADHITAESILNRARAQVAAGETLLAQGAAAKALREFQAAEEQFERLFEHTFRDDLPRTQFLIGASHALNDSPEAALAAFVGLLTWSPKFSMDPSFPHRERVAWLWERARVAKTKLPEGRFRLASTPTNALAYADGQLLGFTPTSTPPLTVGVHYLTLRVEGHERLVRKFTIEQGAQVQERTFTLRPAPAHQNVAAALAQVQERLGAPRIDEPLRTLRDLLQVDHAVFVTVNGATYDVYAYDLIRGQRLANAVVTVGESDDLEHQLAELSDALYTEALRVMIPVTKSAERAPPAPIYRRWWFWTGVGVLATAIIIPVALRAGDGDGSSGACPPDHTCGDVMFRF